MQAFGSESFEVADREKRPYQMSGRIALIPLQGPMSKGGSFKFSGTSTVRTQRALRHAAHDDEVDSILLDVDSPGGHVAGTEELANEVYRARQVKIVGAHISDLGASAALWVASQANFVAANATAEVGSVGTVLALEDSSKRMERLGIDVHVISTGAYKGIGVEGSPLSSEALAYLKSRVEGINQHFLAAVQRGRGLNSTQLGLVSDGRVHLAAAAQQLGLIDSIQSFDDTLSQLRTARTAPQHPRAMRTEAETLPALPLAGDRSHCEQAGDAPRPPRFPHPRYTLQAHRLRTGV